MKPHQRAIRTLVRWCGLAVSAWRGPEHGAAEVQAAPTGTAVDTPLPVPLEALDDKRWLGLVEECVTLFDELDRHRPAFDPASRELADHVCARLQEILARSGVATIADDTTFDRLRHQPDRPAGAVAPGAAIVETLSPGFAVERRVLRRASVRLAETPHAEKGAVR